MTFLIQAIKDKWYIFATSFILVLISKICGLAVPASTKFLIDDVILGKQPEKITFLITAILIASVIQALCTLIVRWMMGKYAHELVSKLRRQSQTHMHKLPLSYFDSQQSGKLAFRIVKDPDSIRHLIGSGLIDLMGSVLTASIAVIVMIYISVKITLIIVAGILFFSVILFKTFSSFNTIHEEQSEYSARASGRLTEGISAIRVIKSYGAEKHEEKAFSDIVELLRSNSVRATLVYSFFSCGTIITLGILTSTILGVGAHQILGGQLTIGSLFFYTTLLAFLVNPIFELVNMGSSLNECRADIQRVLEILAEPEELDGDIILANIDGKIEVQNVSFAYNTDEVIKDISFIAKPGTVTALVGPSGGGKTTIINLIVGFYRPSRGKILIDNIDLSHVKLESYRKKLGIVLQDTFLFDGSIKDNIRFSRPEASDQEIDLACKTAHADEFISKIGYDTVVGERGVKLSGGQKQRLSIARACLAAPRILILDEATSNLDSESERIVQKGLADSIRGRTTFMIAHRLSTIKNADQILVIKDGRIYERGTHDSLIANSEIYSDMWKIQS